MAEFPRTGIEKLSVSRMIIGTNWMLGYSHISSARDKLIGRMHTARTMADIIEVFLKAGVDTLMNPMFVHRGPPHTLLVDAIRDAQDRTGRKVILISTPTLSLEGTPEARSENERTLDKMAELGSSVCLPHQSTTDALLDIRHRRFHDDMHEFCRMIRQRGMIPGLSTHAPQAMVYADETELDVGTYISIYNAIGFLMQIEIDWVQKAIWESRHPVLTIKPLAAGRLMPLVGLAFAWSTIRDKDMVTIGCTTADEARECIDISLSVLNRTGPNVPLQTTRSKASVIRK